MPVRPVLVLGGLALLIAAPTGPSAQTTPTPDQQLAALKQSLAESQKRLRQYEWIETTIISVKGEEKSRKQQRCYYGADGKVQKLPIGDAPQQQAQASGRGRRGGRVMQQVVENKKEDMREYMEQAAALIHQYVPPTAARVQAAKDAGRMAVRPAGEGQIRVEFTDYLQKGDSLGVTANTTASRLSGLDVTTYLDKPDEAVTLKVKMGALADGTVFTEQITFDAAAKHITVVVQNSGYRPVGR